MVWYNYDADKDETLSADEFAALWIIKNDNWMTTDEAVEVMALVSASSSTTGTVATTVTFDEVVTYIKEQEAINEAFSTFW